jgi:hypothetical protein
MWLTTLILRVKYDFIKVGHQSKFLIWKTPVPRRTVPSEFWAPKTRLRLEMFHRQRKLRGSAELSANTVRDSEKKGPQRGEDRCAGGRNLEAEARRTVLKRNRRAERPTEPRTRSAEIAEACDRAHRHGVAMKKKNEHAQ